MNDYFEVFGLPRKLQVDLDALQRSFYELSRRHHPDFHQGAGAEAQDRALEASALVNRAYRALRDPVARVEYLIALEEGREVREETTAKAKVPMDLLAEMLEVQEALEEAKSAELTDEAAGRLRAERQRLRERHQAEEDALIAVAPEWDAAVDAGEEREASPRAIQATAGGARLPPHRDRRSHSSDRGGRRESCRASSALISGPPIASSRTSTGRVSRGSSRTPRDGSFYRRSWPIPPHGVMVGETARRQLARNPARTVYSVKRFMGRGWDDVREEARHVPFDDHSQRRGGPDPRGRPRGHAARSVGPDAAGAQAPGGGPSRASRSSEPSSPCRPTSTTPSARRPRTPAASPASRCCASSTSRRQLRSPTDSRSWPRA